MINLRSQTDFIQIFEITLTWSNFFSAICIKTIERYSCACQKMWNLKCVKKSN